MVVLRGGISPEKLAPLTLKDGTPSMIEPSRYCALEVLPIVYVWLVRMTEFGRPRRFRRGG